MIRNYVLLSLTLLVIIPFLVLDVHASVEPTSERNIEDFITNNVVNYTDYSAKINNASSNYDGDPMIYYGIGPKCFDDVLKISPKVKEKSNGDIVLKFTKNFGEHHPQVFLAITGEDINRSISKPLNQSDNSKYKITISKDDIINITNNDVSVRVFFFLSQNTTSSDLVISTSESGSPLYYLSNKALKDNVVLQLPNPTGTEFVNGTIQKISGYTPSNNASISLVDDTVCKYGKINDIFEISSKIELAPSLDTLPESPNHQGAAQTSGSGSPALNLAPPTGVPAPQFTSVRIISDSGVTSGYIPVPENGASYTHANMTNKPKVGDLFIQDPTNILSNPLFLGSEEFDCSAVVETVSYAIDNSDIPDLAIPDNIKPKAKKKLVALGINFFATGSSPQESCSPDPEDSSVYALVTDSEMRVTLYDQSNRSPYYFSPRENITQAQPIPACSDINYDASDQTLKGDTKMCYGTHGDDIVIITKRLTGFYGAAKTVTTPTSPANLDVTGPPTLTPSENIPAPVFRSVAIYSDAGTDTAYVSSPTSAGFTYGDYQNVSGTGDIFIPDDTNILSNSLFPTDRDTECGGVVTPVSYAIKYNLVSDLVMPYNIEPRDRDTLVALGLNFDITRGSTNSEVTSSCSPDLNSQSSDPLITDKEMRVTLYDTTFKNPYHFSPREGINAAQPIHVCSDTNYDASDQTLKGDTKMCYGIHGDNLVIITKQLTGFYGAADRIIDSTATALTLSPPTNAPAPVYGYFRILSDDGETTGYIPGSDNGASYTHDGKSIGDLFIPHPTGILSNPLFLGSEEFDCSAVVETVSYAIDNSDIPDLAIPDNIKPKAKKKLVALGINFFATGSSPQESCSPDLNSQSSDPLITDKEMRVTLDGVATKKPYYFSPRDNVYNAQYIPLCTSSNYDTDDQTLKGDTKMCHGINGDDMVIITKRLTGFYGAADIVN